MFGGSKLRQFSVEFDNEEKKFLPGDQVTGHVIVDLVKAKNVRGNTFLAIFNLPILVA